MFNNLLIRLKSFEIDFNILKNELLNLNNILKLNLNNDKIQNFIIKFEVLYSKLQNLIKYDFNILLFMVYNNIVYAYFAFKNAIIKL